MYGPEPKGHWTQRPGATPGAAHQHLVAGKKYVVAQAFRDFDQALHPVGEAWRFIGFSFSPYDDGLSYFVSLDDEHEWQIRLQWSKEAQGPIIDDLGSYVKEA